MTLRMRLGLLAAAFSLLHLPSEAALCTPPTVEKESPYRYMVSLVEALSYAKSGLERIGPSSQQPRRTDFDLLLGLKLGKADFECAKLQVSPYSMSSNDAIKTSAGGSALVFSRLVNLTDKSVEEYKAVLDSLSNGNVKLGTTLERQAELGASFDEAWRLLVTAVIAGTYAIIEVEPTTGLMSRLCVDPRPKGQDPSKAAINVWQPSHERVEGRTDLVSCCRFCTLPGRRRRKAAVAIQMTA